MKRIFLVASCPTINIGYSRIAHQLANHLALTFKVYYFAYSRTNGDEVPRHVHPNITLFDVVGAEVQDHLAKGKTLDTYEQLYGSAYFLDHLKRFDPDVLLIYNDLIVLANRLSQLVDMSITFKIVSYADIVYEYPRQDIMDLISSRSDRVYTFSDCWTKHVTQDLGFPIDKVKSLPHGIDACFFKVDVQEARTALGLPLNGFLVLNTNRNSYRKRLDITVYAFFAFWQLVGCPDHVYLVLNCELYSDREYNVKWLLESNSRRLRLDKEAMSHRILHTSSKGALTDANMNLLYNACDVGLNTGNAEGFGLCNLEHASIGKPQVVSGVGSFKDIFGPGLSTMVPSIASYELTRMHGPDYGLVKVFNELEYAYRLKDVYEHYQAKVTEFADIVPRIKIKYNWTTIMQQCTKDLVALTGQDYRIIRLLLNTDATGLEKHRRWFHHCRPSPELALMEYVKDQEDHWVVVISYDDEFVVPSSVTDFLDLVQGPDRPSRLGPKAQYPAFTMSTGGPSDSKSVRVGLVTSIGYLKQQGFGLWSNRMSLPFVPSSGYMQSWR